MGSLRRAFSIGLCALCCALFAVAAAPPVSGAPAPVTQLASGFQHNCLVSAGNVWCWGDNSVTQLGQGSSGGSSSVPVEVVDPNDGSGHLSNVVQISAGTYDVCALKSDNSVWCWGTLGQNLNNPGGWHPTPVPLTTFAGVNGAPRAAVVAGQFDVCALAPDLTTLECGNDGGRSVVGTHTFPQPVAIDAAGHSMLGLAGYEACAGLTDGTVYCFGDNGFGGPAVPTQAIGTWGAVSVRGVVADYNNDACGTFSDGSAWCWSDNGSSSNFVQVLPPGSGAGVIAGANGHLCTLVTAGGATCFSPFGSPTPVSGLGGATQIGANGIGGGCALVNGGVQCWGDDSYGQLGNGTIGASSPTPVNVTGFGPVATDDDLALTNVPASFAVNATSPAGTTVTYAAPTVVDEDLPLPVVGCLPASGSTFAIGATTVTCTVSAAGDTNSPVSAQFTVTVRGADAQLSTLAASLSGIDGGSFVAELQGVRAALTSGKPAACNKLNAFTNHVRAQAGKKLTTAQANQSLADASRIAAVIGC